MKGYSIDCRPSLTEDHLQQIQAAMMDITPGQSVSVSLSPQDKAKIPEVLDMMTASGLEAKTDYSMFTAVISGRKSVDQSGE